VNCNIYDAKDKVWMNGGPVTQSLGDGTYFFAVLSPSGQNNEVNDGTDPAADKGTPHNLSDDVDAYTNRTFSIASGVISYPGTHLFEGNLIRLFDYSNTLNPGGVYTMAICKINDSENNNVYPVDPSSCKYDAFKIQAEGEIPEASAPTVSKDAAGTNDRKYAWTILKAVDKTTVTITGGSATFNYTVTVSHDTGTVSNVAVSGNITVTNTTGADILDVAIEDTLSDGTACSITGGSTGLTVPDGGKTFAYTCAVTGAAKPTGNSVKITWPEQLLDDGSLLAAGSDAYNTIDPIAYTETAIDETISVTDTYAGALGTVSVGDPNPTQFKYSRTIPGTLGSCASYDNTATFTTNDTGATGSSSQTVTVCTFRASLTIGYWKNHLAPVGTILPGINNGKACTTNTGCNNNGPYANSFLPQTLGSYSVSTARIVLDIMNANNCSSSTSQDAIACLAAQLLGAKLNVANIANSCIGPTIVLADNFLKAIPLTGSPSVTSYSGVTGNYSKLTAAGRATAIALKTTLDKYNNGTCPP